MTGKQFVRGRCHRRDPIMVINVVGGLLVGVLQHGMSMGHAAESYTLLTIGDLSGGTNSGAGDFYRRGSSLRVSAPIRMLASRW